jgi:hypothetical protein
VSNILTSRVSGFFLKQTYPDPSISGRFTGGKSGLFTAHSGGYLPARGACRGGYGLPPIGLARENREWARYLESEI